MARTRMTHGSTANGGALKKVSPAVVPPVQPPTYAAIKMVIDKEQKANQESKAESN